MSNKSPREIRRFQTTEIYSMDGRKIGSLIFQTGEHLSGSAWRRLKQFVVDHFECDEDSVGTDQTEEHMDILTVDGQHVAYTQEQGA